MKLKAQKTTNSLNFCPFHREIIMKNQDKNGVLAM